MDSVTDSFPPEIEIALSYAPAKWRPHWHALFALDQRLAKLVSSTSEPMLAQIKLAWWRDRLSEPIEQRPTGDHVLDQLQSWAGSEEALIAIVDAWEVLVAEDLEQADVSRFLKGRARPFAELAILSGSPELAKQAGTTAELWALSDLVSHLSSEQERTEMLTAFAHRTGQLAIRWPSEMRPLAVLSALANRHLSYPENPILTRRRDALIALRAGIFGR